MNKADLDSQQWREGRMAQIDAVIREDEEAQRLRAIEEETRLAVCLARIEAHERARAKDERRNK